MIPASSADVVSLASQMAAAAQRVYDEWDQDEDGQDELLGAGGICDLVAAAMIQVVCEHHDVAISTEYDEIDTHTRFVVRLSDGVFQVDIPASVYEIGYGYVWKKRDGVTIGIGDVVVDRLDVDPSNFGLYSTSFDPEHDFMEADEATIVAPPAP